MPTEQEVEDMIASYTPDEAELMRELLEDGEDELDFNS